MLKKLTLGLSPYLYSTLMVVALLAVCPTNCNEPETIEIVHRRPSGDTFKSFNSSILSTCSDHNELTYLVSEGQCVRNQELLNGMKLS